MTSNIMDRIFSKMNDKGIKIAYWVSSVLTISFLVSFIINTIYTTAFRGFGIIDRILSGSNDKNELEWLILLYILAILVELIPLLILNAIRKWTKSRVNEDIDKKSIYFATGIYIIFINIFGIVSTVNSIVGLLFNGRWGVHIDSNSIVYHPWQEDPHPLAFLARVVRAQVVDELPAPQMRRFFERITSHITGKVVQ